MESRKIGRTPMFPYLSNDKSRLNFLRAREIYNSRRMLNPFLSEVSLESTRSSVLESKKEVLSKEFNFSPKVLREDLTDSKTKDILEELDSQLKETSEFPQQEESQDSDDGCNESDRDSITSFIPFIRSIFPPSDLGKRHSKVLNQLVQNDLSKLKYFQIDGFPYIREDLKSVYLELKDLPSLNTPILWSSNEEDPLNEKEFENESIFDFIKSAREDDDEDKRLQLEVVNYILEPENAEIKDNDIEYQRPFQAGTEKISTALRKDSSQEIKTSADNRETTSDEESHRQAGFKPKKPNNYPIIDNAKESSCFEAANFRFVSKEPNVKDQILENSLINPKKSLSFKLRDETSNTASYASTGASNNRVSNNKTTTNEAISEVTIEDDVPEKKTDEEFKSNVEHNHQSEPSFKDIKTISSRNEANSKLNLKQNSSTERGDKENMEDNIFKKESKDNSVQVLTLEDNIQFDETKLGNNNSGEKPSLNIEPNVIVNEEDRSINLCLDLNNNVDSNRQENNEIEAKTTLTKKPYYFHTSFGFNASKMETTSPEFKSSKNEYNSHNSSTSIRYLNNLYKEPDKACNDKLRKNEALNISLNQSVSESDKFLYSAELEADRSTDIYGRKFKSIKMKTDILGCKSDERKCSSDRNESIKIVKEDDNNNSTTHQEFYSKITGSITSKNQKDPPSPTVTSYYFNSSAPVFKKPDRPNEHKVPKGTKNTSRSQISLRNLSFKINLEAKRSKREFHNENEFLTSSYFNPKQVVKESKNNKVLKSEEPKGETLVKTLCVSSSSINKRKIKKIKVSPLLLT